MCVCVCVSSVSETEKQGEGVQDSERREESAGREGGMVRIKS